MPYQRSRARNTFDLEVESLIDVIWEAHSRRCKLPSVRLHVLCSAVMLCSAKIEVYLEDVIGDWIKSINTHGCKTDELPLHFRAFYSNSQGVLALYKAYLASNDEAEFIKRLSKTISQDYRQLAIDGLAVPNLQAKQVYSDKKYPSPDNLKLLFFRLGIMDIFQEVNKSARADLKSVLVSFNDIRTSVAHQGIPVGLNANDIVKKLREVKRMIGHIDRVLFSHIVRHTGLKCWQT